MRSEKDLKKAMASKHNSSEFAEKLSRLLNGDESCRRYVENVLDKRAESAFVQQGHHPGNIGYVG